MEGFYRFELNNDHWKSQAKRFDCLIERFVNQNPENPYTVIRITRNGLSTEMEPCHVLGFFQGLSFCKRGLEVDSECRV